MLGPIEEPRFFVEKEVLDVTANTGLPIPTQVLKAECRRSSLLKMFLKCVSSERTFRRASAGSLGTRNLYCFLHSCFTEPSTVGTVVTAPISQSRKLRLGGVQTTLAQGLLVSEGHSWVWTQASGLPKPRSIIDCPAPKESTRKHCWEDSKTFKFFPKPSFCLKGLVYKRATKTKEQEQSRRRPVHLVRQSRRCLQAREQCPCPASLSSGTMWGCPGHLTGGTPVLKGEAMEAALYRGGSWGPDWGECSLVSRSSPSESAVERKGFPCQL